MAVTPAMVKELREKTGVGIMECKAVLSEAKGDIEKAIELLRKKGLSMAAKKAGRTTTEGLVGSYIHTGGKIGVLVEIGCETDFVARTPDFQELVKEIAMQVAAANPQYVKREDIPEERIEMERDIYRAQAKETGKPDHVVEKIVDGKMEKYYSEVSLLEQPYIKDPSIKVQDLLSQKIAKLGENIVVKRFVRFQIGLD